MLVHSRLHYFLSRKAGCRPPLRPSTVQPNRPDDWIRLGGDILPVVKARTKSSTITTGRQAAADLARTVAGIAQFGTPQANRTPVPAVRGRCPDRWTMMGASDDGGGNSPPLERTPAWLLTTLLAQSNQTGCHINLRTQQQFRSSHAEDPREI